MSRVGTLGSLLLIVAFSASINAQSPDVSLTGRIGTVEILRNGAWVAAMAGDEVAPGEHVRTGRQSSAALQLGKGKVITLSELTEVEVQANSSLSLKLETGRMKVVSDGNPQVATNHVPPEPRQEPADAAPGAKDNDRNITIIVNNNGANPAVSPYTPPAPTIPRYGDGLTNSTFYSFPFFPSFGSPVFIPNVVQGPEFHGDFPGNRPGVVVPPMTDPLRPPVHFPISPFPDRRVPR